MSAARVLLSWSSGKDSAWALHVLQQQRGLEVVGLLTTLNDAFGRVAMHGVPEALLDAQANAAGLPLWKLPLPWPCPNERYEALMSEVIGGLGARRSRSSPSGISSSRRFAPTASAS
jgi:diphthamide synthase (EF-2-diphthine--ammonia ligase)